jgi:hypothetical protein
MDDFKRIVKMKTGGSVSKAIEAYEKRERKTEMSGDMTQDKSMVKKGVKQHETALHKGEPKTELKLKNGGRTKKAVGTVKKYKCGGGVYGAKKTKEDIKNIDAAKDCKPKKLQAGGMSGPAQAGLAAGLAAAPMGQGQLTQLEKQRQMEKMKRAQQYLTPSQQGELISQDPRAAGLTPMTRKNGGKIKKCADGGSLKPTNAEENPGLAKLPTDVRNKMGYLRKGGKAKKMMSGGTCS